MKREADKIAEKRRESEKKLRVVEPRSQSRGFAPAPLKLYPQNRNKRIETKIAVLNKKIRRVRQNKIGSALIA